MEDTNESGVRHPDLATALAAAQAEISDPARNKQAKIPGRTKYRYAGLDDLLQAIRPVLGRHGIAFVQAMEVREGGVVVLVTKLLHGPSDEEQVSEYLLSWTGKPQDKGSELTYARRYSLEALAGVAATMDDDGGSEVVDAQAPAMPPPPPPAPPTWWTPRQAKDWSAAIGRQPLGLQATPFNRWIVDTKGRGHPGTWTEHQRRTVLDKLIAAGEVPEAYINFMNRPDDEVERPSDEVGHQ